MTDMFIPKRERIIITIEAIVYVLLIIMASYFTISGNIFIKMIPLVYLLGILGVIAFDRPIVTVILSGISTITFGVLIEQELNLDIALYAIYSIFMLICGEITGHILKLFYENFRLRKFIKYYNKIIYFCILVLCTVIPVFLNNVVNSNIVSYNIAKKAVDKYIRGNYVYTNYQINNAKYLPSYQGGVYEFEVVLDNIEIKLNYSDNEIADINMDNRKEELNKIANAEINMLLKKYDLTSLNVKCMYDYSKIASVPDIIRIDISDVSYSQIDSVVEFIQHIKEWNKYESIDRLNIVIDGVNVSISKKELNDKNINREFILNGTKYEILSSKEDR